MKVDRTGILALQTQMKKANSEVIQSDMGLGLRNQQNMMIYANNGDVLTATLGQLPPKMVRRPSVLYKKKAETAKQRQERYIRRV